MHLSVTLYCVCFRMVFPRNIERIFEVIGRSGVDTTYVPVIYDYGSRLVPIVYERSGRDVEESDSDGSEFELEPKMIIHDSGAEPVSEPEPKTPEDNRQYISLMSDCLDLGMQAGNRWRIGNPNMGLIRNSLKKAKAKARTPWPDTDVREIIRKNLDFYSDQIYENDPPKRFLIDEENAILNSQK